MLISLPVLGIDESARPNRLRINRLRNCVTTIVEALDICSVFNPSVACVLRIDLYNGFRVELSEKRSAEPLTVYAIARALTHADKRILLIKRILKS